MECFKLLAIRPLDGCSQDILKNLKNNECYLLDNSYEFDHRLNTLRKKENYNDISNLYTTGNLNIQISTIVGENGSGKTSLIELIILFMTSIIVKSTNDQDISAFNCEIYFYNTEINVLKFENNIFKLNNKEIRALCLLENNDLYWFLHYLNYSPFSLINSSFAEYFGHKNNKYWENILITPKRENNVLDIENELYINQLNSLYILSHYNPLNINKIKYNFKDAKLLNIRVFDSNEVNFHFQINDAPLDISVAINNYETILNKVFHYFSIDSVEVNFILKQYVDYQYYTSDTKKLNKEIIKGFCLIYIVNKLIKFSKNLEKNPIININEVDKFEYIYLTSLKSEPSHLSFKLVQTINFFKNSLFFDEIGIEKNEFYLSYDSLCRIVEVPLDNELSFEFYVPISGFKITLLKDDIDISKNSSGQLQLFSTISNILINIIRLNSRTFEYYKDNKENENASGRFFYNTVIVLDELEINLHPKFQKNLINELIVAIGNLNLHLRGIQIIFLTHSPFILSDIPSQYVLKLKDGNPQFSGETNSFAANIYDLLNDEFFLENGAIGAFASKKINDILIKEKIEEEDWTVINIIGDPFLKGVIKKKIEENISDEILNKEIKRLQDIKQKRSQDAANK